MPHLNEAQRNNAIGILHVEASESQTAVTRVFNVNQSTISQLSDRFRKHRSTRDLRRSGQPRVTTNAQDCYIRLQHLREQSRTATSTASFIL